MSYTVKQLATLAGVSVRTLHHYDSIGLLEPARVADNGYRYYEESELLKLQQILFFRELDMPLGDIKQILSSPYFDMQEALRSHRTLIELKKNRLNGLLKTIDKTIKKLNHEITMDDTELYGNFTKEEMERYTEEARQRWGHTEAFQQSQQRIEKMGQAGLQKAVKANDALTRMIGAAMQDGKQADSAPVQALIAKHYAWLRAFYEPNLTMYRGLATLYSTDERFRATYDAVAPGLADFMHDAMVHYADTQEKTAS